MKSSTRVCLLFILTLIAELYAANNSFKRTRRIFPIASDSEGGVDVNDLRQAYDTLKSAAETTIYKLKTKLNKLTKQEDFKKSAVCLVVPLKDFDSLKRKLNSETKLQDYKGKKVYVLDAITDLIRSSVIFEDESNVHMTQFMLGMSKLYSNAIDIKNKFYFPQENGYKNIHNIYNSTESLTINGDKYEIPIEVQIHSCGIFLANKSIHIFYEVKRIMKLFKVSSNDFENALKNAKTTKESFDEIINKAKILLKLLKDEVVLKLIAKFEEKHHATDAELLVESLKKMETNINNEVSKKIHSKKCFELLKPVINDKCEPESFLKLGEVSEEFLKEVFTKGVKDH